MPPKTAFVLNSAVIGGAERYLEQVVRRVPGSVAVVGRHSPTSELIARQAGTALTVQMGDCLDRWRGLNLFLPTNRRLRQRFIDLFERLKRDGIDLVHVQTYKEQLIASPAATAAGLPVIWTQHCLAPAWLARSPIRRLYAAAANRHCARIAAISQAAKRDLVNVGVDEEKIEVIPNGVDLVRFSPGDGRAVREMLGVAADEQLIGCAGRLHRLKGQKSLIESLPKVFGRHPNARCVFVGAGRREEEYRRLARRLGVQDRVIFVGFVENVADYLRAMDVYVCPSLFEAFGLNVTEAMACGKAVVATDAGGLREQIVDGKNGLLVRPGDPSSLARAIETLLDDRDLAERLGREARRTCEASFDQEEMLRRTIELLDRVLEEARSSCEVMPETRERG